MNYWIPATASVKKGSNTSKGFKTLSFGTFFYAQGLSKVLVEIPVLLRWFEVKVFENTLSIKLLKPVSLFVNDFQGSVPLIETPGLHLLFN